MSNPIPPSAEVQAATIATETGLPEGLISRLLRAPDCAPDCPCREDQETSP